MNYWLIYASALASHVKSELIRLRDDVNRTLAAIDPGISSTQKDHFPTSYPSDGDAIRTNLQRINAKIFEVSSEKENQAKEIADLRQKLAESQVLEFFLDWSINWFADKGKTSWGGGT